MTVAIHKPLKLNNRLQFHYGKEVIYFERLTRKNDVNRILIKVHPDCRVEVAAPINAEDAEIINAVKKKRRWIYEKLRDFRRQLEYITPRKYVSGESHYYLGKHYLLKIISSNYFEGVKLLRGKLEVYVSEKSTDKIKQLLADWYVSRAKEVFNKRLNTLLEQAVWVGSPPPLYIRAMKTQWGNCSPTGRLTLNPYLVKAPKECIDYVILHELCHLAEHNHSERFYRLMNQVMPKWEGVKERLDGMANMIL